MKKMLKKIMPGYLLEYLIHFHFNYIKYFEELLEPIKIKIAPFQHKIAVKKVRKKDKIKVAFFLIHDSVWKYEGVYNLMEQDERFDPVVIVCPYIAFGEETMLKDMNQAYLSFKEKGYHVIRTLNEETGSWLNVKKEIKPDIIFFTNPHKLTKGEYYINNFLDKLTCYVQYSFHVSCLNQSQYNQFFHNVIWSAYYETPIHKKMGVYTSRNKGLNIKVTGYPGLDLFCDKNYRPKSIWKNNNLNKKRIIWAPHHTILKNDAELGYSTFLQYAEFMLKIAAQNKKTIEIAFKPHPILKSKLYLHEDWGISKTDNYFKKWELESNTLLNEGSYTDLFLTSDAIIHDSGSFVVEYLCVNKPALFLIRENEVQDKFNEFGKLALAIHEFAYCENDIKIFIDNLINDVPDENKNKREAFYQDYLTPPNGVSASQNILNYLIKDLKL